MLQWDAAEDALFQLAKAQLEDFFEETDLADLYGLGFFADPLEGVGLVANGRRYLETARADYCQVAIDPNLNSTRWDDQFKWEIGNWEFPGDLGYPLDDLDAVWDEFRAELKQIDDEDDVERIVNLCVRVLERLHADGVFAVLPALEGLTVQGHDDTAEMVLPRKERLDALLKNPVDSGS